MPCACHIISTYYTRIYLKHICIPKCVEYPPLYNNSTICFPLRSRSTSGRGILFPLGDTSRRFVQEGNLLASRVVLLLWICVSRGLIWLVEQPEGSIFNLHPRWQEFVTHCPATWLKSRVLFKQSKLLLCYLGAYVETKRNMYVPFYMCSIILDLALSV